MQAPFADPLSGLDILNQALPLVGRETEMQMMRYLLNTVALNLPTGPRSMTISGEIGVGKSRLLAEMYGEARQLGFRILEGRTYESGSMFPFLPFIEALRPVLRSSPPEQLRHYLGLDAIATSNEGNGYSVDERDSNGQSTDGAESEIIALVGIPLIAALARLFPELPKMAGVRILPEVLSPDQEKFRLLDAVATLLERIAEDQPVLLGIDNLQWADSASLELTMYLTVRLHSSRVALVGATRPPNTQSTQAENSDRVVTVKASMTAAKILGDLMRQGLLMLLPLSPLAREASVQHIHTLLPGTLPESIEQSLLNRAEGNPFFLEELVRMLTLKHQLVQHGKSWLATKNTGTELPSSITLAVGQRLEGLSSACRETLRVAAHFGRTFPLDALLHVLAAAGEGYDGLAAIEEATQAAVIVLAPADETKRNGLDDDWLDAANDGIANVQVAPALYMFCQGIVQEVLHAEIPTHKTGALHSAIGSALEETYGQEAPAHAAELARHYTLGGNKAASLRWSLLAGENAVRQQAHREAIGHFRTVVRLLEASEASEASETTPNIPSLAQLSITIGELWFKLGELELAASAFQKALERLQSVGQNGAKIEAAVPLQLAQANRLIADVYRMQAKYDQALAHLQAARAALDTEASEGAVVLEEQGIHGKAGEVPWFAGRSFSNDGKALTLERVSTAERILLLQAMATLNILLYRTQEAETALWQSHQLAVQSGDRGSQAFAIHLIGWLRGWGVHIHEAIRLQEQAHALYIAIGDPFRAALGEQGLGIIYQALGEMERAHQYTTRGFERARRYGVRYVYGLLHLNFGILALAQGDWAKSEYHLQEALQEAKFTNNIRLKPLVMLAQAALLFRRGRWQEAEHYFQSGNEAAVNTEWYPGALALYGHFLAVTGRRAAARTQLDKAADYPESPGFGGDFYIPFIAEGYLHLDADERAATYIERIRDLRGFMYYGLSVDRVLGVVATRAGDWQMAEQAFEDGLALCRRANNQPEEGMILYEQARAALMQHGTRTQTVRRVDELCQQARTLFLQYGMQRSVDLVDTLQEGIRQLEQREDALDKQQIKSAPGIRTPMQERGAVFSEYQLDLSLTKRELEVLRLVAEGHTDREVAETLIISPRTVNRHLSNIFVKIDVPGRAAAVAYAIRQGLV